VYGVDAVVMRRAPDHDRLQTMNKRLAALMERVGTWPDAVQEEAARALTAIEEKHVGAPGPLAPEDETKLAALRETINRSIECGGSYTDEEVAAYIDRMHTQSERIPSWPGLSRPSTS
jgi:acetylornithine deacetylase/succinyl-diaminopimelate desuccinylase-like protein